MKRLLIIPALLFAFAANAYDRVPPEPIIRHVEPVSQEAVDLVDALNVIMRNIVDTKPSMNSIRYMVFRDVLAIVPFDSEFISGVRLQIELRQTRLVCNMLGILTNFELLPLKPGVPAIADQLRSAGITSIGVMAVNHTCPLL